MPRRGPHRPFTARQNQIADGILRGLSYKQIGHELAISEHTVAAHVRMMAMLFDASGDLGEQLPPRTVILVYAAYRQLELEKPAVAVAS